MEQQVPTGKCPRCGKAVSWNERFPDRPFCSERCKLIDLGDWLAEANRIPGEDEFADGAAEKPDHH